MTETKPLRPTDVFMHLIVTFLTPMFLAATGGDITFARIAATETVNAHTARNPADLLPIALIIAFGLATLDSLSRSMHETLSLSLILRLRGNATSLNRSAETSRRALRDPLPEQATAADHAQEEAVIAELARAEQRINQAAATAEPTPPTPPATTPTSTTPPATTPLATTPLATTPLAQPPSRPATAPATTAATIDDRKIWAAAMSNVAREYTADLPFLPPSERREATMRATVLSSVAHELLSGQPVPQPFKFNSPPKPPHRTARP